ncbi:electron transfer flavoprotein regulatory factor 1-like [Babylonia areolata]|uniref:electron transfer flavoprotein regulatory factor 1-like n=1 Tax=Babylonia areolata TaxID=304850 RepID=UPI003FD39862
MSSQPLRPKVIQLYKTLLFLGRDYPKGYDYFRTKLKNAFMKHKDVADPAEIEMLLARGDYIVKELEALYMLRKYRTLKKRYYSDKPGS